MLAAYFKHHHNTILILTPMPPPPLPKEERGEGGVQGRVRGRNGKLLIPAFPL